MRTLRISVLISMLVMAMFVLAACGGGDSNNTGTSNNTTTGSDKNSSYGSSQSGGDKNSYGSTSTPTTAASTSAGPAVKVAMATVDGKKVKILTDTHGMTLYYFTPDTKTTSACGSGCTGTWPPLLSDAAQPAVTGLSGKLTAVKDDSGMQVQYNGHFLYTYAADTAAGQTNGQGVGGKWFVATDNLS
ncbi:hypothetical protein KDW_54290 [Dictyobacter vulcani]|uniref:Lipoprotein n=1 Tax=Dictyobacter vulcani TaxID=2607529 RepID=A0A5J4KXJ8_9CHLR|nr:hypothetical protein [Dictyobacter vulcani]GER91267.1 hypothetical protein KDW_54290 [Dictyobacter vulcani]